jgi:DNA-binding MarR family transcriptional regulator
MSADADLDAVLKALRRIVRAMDVQSRRADRSLGLTLPQLVVLRCVRDLGEGTGRAVALAADISPATVVGILDKLEAKGLVTRIRSAEDRRLVRNALTPAGLEALVRAPAPLGEDFERRFLALPAADRALALAGLSLVAGCAGPAT